MTQDHRVIITDVTNKKLLSEWQQLWTISSTANYSNSPQWFETACATYNYPKNFILALYIKSSLECVIGVVSTKRYGISCLVRPGNYNCGTPFLTKNNHNRLANIRLSVGELAKLGTIMLEDIEGTESQIINIDRPYSSIIPGGTNLLISTKSADKQYFHKRILHIIPKAAKKLSEFTLIKSEPTNTSSLKMAYAIDLQSTKHLNGYNTFNNPLDQQFYLRLSTNKDLHMTCFLLFHKSLPDPIAYDLGFKIGDTYYSNQTATLSLLSRYSPGKIILVKIVNYFFNSPINYIDLGSGDSTYKRLYTNEGQPLFHVTFSTYRLAVLYLTKIRLFQDILYTWIIKLNLYKKYRQYRLKLSR